MSEIQNETIETNSSKLTAEDLAQLESGEKSLSTLSDEQLEEILSEKVTDGRGQFDAEQRKPRAEEKTEENSSAQKEIIQDKKDEKKSLWDRFREKADESNRWYQKYNADQKKKEDHEKKLREDEAYRKDYFEKIGIKVPEVTKQKEIEPEEELDPYSEENLKKIKYLEDEIRELKAFKEEQKREKEFFEKRKSEEDRIYKSIEQLEEIQKSYPELKLEKSFKETDLEYSNWIDRIGGETNARRYFSDAEFRKEADAHGLQVIRDYDKYSVLTDIYSRSGKYPTIKSAFKDSEYYDAIMDHRMQSREEKAPSREDTSKIINERIVENSQKPKIIGQSQSASSFGDEWTDEAMFNWLKENPDARNYTKSQNDTFDFIMKKLNMKE